MTCFQIYKPFWVLLIFLLFCKSEPVPKKEYTCVPKNLSTSTEPRCGKVLTTSSGFISHKPYTSINSNERCVWTINVLQGDIYEIDVLYLGFPNSNETVSSKPSLIISTAPYDNVSLPSIIIPTTTGVFNFRGTLIIAFSSGELDGFDDYTGFILQYKTSSTLPGSQLDHKILMPRVIVNFTSEGYNNFGTFVFPPENNTYPGTPYHIIYLEYGSTTCTTDCINVHHFNRSNLTHPWQFFQQFCCRQQTAVIQGHDDLWMVRVASRGDRGRYDFILFNERCQN